MSDGSRGEGRRREWKKTEEKGVGEYFEEMGILVRSCLWRDSVLRQDSLRQLHSDAIICYSFILSSLFLRLLSSLLSMHLCITVYSLFFPPWKYLRGLWPRPLDPHLLEIWESDQLQQLIPLGLCEGLRRRTLDPRLERRKQENKKEGCKCVPFFRVHTQANRACSESTSC